MICLGRANAVKLRVGLLNYPGLATKGYVVPGYPPGFLRL